MCGRWSRYLIQRGESWASVRVQDIACQFGNASNGAKTAQVYSRRLKEGSSSSQFVGQGHQVSLLFYIAYYVLLSQYKATFVLIILYNYMKQCNVCSYLLKIWWHLVITALRAVIWLHAKQIWKITFIVLIKQCFVCGKIICNSLAYHILCHHNPVVNIFLLQLTNALFVIISFLHWTVWKAILSVII